MANSSTIKKQQRPPSNKMLTSSLTSTGSSWTRLAIFILAFDQVITSGKSLISKLLFLQRIRAFNQLVFFLNLVHSQENDERVKLSDVLTITLFKDRFTNSRRHNPIPQVCLNFE